MDTDVMIRAFLAWQRYLLLPLKNSAQSEVMF